MNLILDIGNTHVKLACFKEENIIFQERFTKSFLSAHIRSVFSHYSIERAIISNVSRVSKNAINKISKQCSLHLLNYTSKLPFKNCYATPQTLGADRIALVAAASHQIPDKNVLIIDAGTCITYDFLNSANEYLGGAISPGIHIRYKAIHSFTSHLPLLERDDFLGFIGNSTATSIHSGVLNGIVYEIDAVIERYQQEYEDLTVILTGGDADFLAKRLKNTIFANSNFLIEGLNAILECNQN